MIESVNSLTKTESVDPHVSVQERAAESRLDPLTGNWTIFSPQRADRPEEFVDDGETVNTQVECPFCPGNEEVTPPAVWIGQISDEDSTLDVLKPCDTQPLNQDWSVRVVPNRFPAVQPVQPVQGAVGEHRESGLFQRRPVVGGHEVIIESRQHVQSLTELDLAELHLVFQAYRDRIQHWRGVSGVSYISAFKNVGGKAGASLRHTHSQLIATDRMPTGVSNSLDRMVRHRATSGCCLSCDLVRGELKSKQRVIWADQSLIAFCPFASPLPMTVRVTTLEHQACFEDLNDDTLESVSRLTNRVLSWLERLRPGTPYNFCLHTRPPAMVDPHDSFHWWIDIFPRMTQIAGFEFSSQCMINPILPEESAAKFRACARAEDPRRQL